MPKARASTRSPTARLKKISLRIHLDQPKWQYRSNPIAGDDNVAGRVYRIHGMVRVMAASAEWRNFSTEQVLAFIRARSWSGARVNRRAERCNSNALPGIGDSRSTAGWCLPPQQSPIAR